jgi:hypothetical protein
MTHVRELMSIKSRAQPRPNGIIVWKGLLQYCMSISVCLPSRRQGLYEYALQTRKIVEINSNQLYTVYSLQCYEYDRRRAGTHTATGRD